MIETRICKKCGAEVHGFHRASDCKPAIEMIKRGGIDVMRCTVCGREWYAAENVKHTHEEQGMPNETESTNAPRRVCTCPPKHRIATCTIHGHIVREPEIAAIVDPTTNAIEAIARERDELRATVQGMKDAIAPAVIEQAARSERSALAARDVALERADRLDRENDGLHAFRRGILAALHMPENGDAISKVRGLMSHDRTDVLERDLAGVREQLDITRRKLEETARFNDLILAADQRGAKMYRDAHPEKTTLLAPDRAGLVAWLLGRLDDAAAASKIHEDGALEDREARRTAERRLQLANERIEAIENEPSQRLYGNTQKILDGAGIGPGTVLERVRELAKLHKTEHEDRVTAHRALSLAIVDRDKASDALCDSMATERRTQAALDKFMGAVGDQTVQIMELRSALREVKPDHPMFNGSGSARAGDATPG